jgi:hypothetical protein
MPSPAQIALLVGLVVVAGVHTRSRIAGAVAATIWVACGLVWGATAFEGRSSLRFLGIEAPPWLFFAFFGGLLVFNVTVLARAFRRRRASAPGADRGPSPGAS